MNRERALSFAQKFGVILAGFDDDENVVKCAVKVNGDAILSASDELKKSLDIIKIASQDGRFDIINYLENLVVNNEELKADDSFMKEVIGYNPFLISVASDSIKDNSSIAEYCVKYSSSLLNEVSDRLKKDEYLWQIASIDKNFDLIDFLFKLIKKGEYFTSDDNFMRNAINVEATCLKYASDNIKDDKTVVMRCVQMYPILTNCISLRLRDDKEIASYALLNSRQGEGYYVFGTLSDRLKKDRQLWEIAGRDKDFYIPDYIETLINNDHSLLNNVEFMKDATIYNQELLVDASDTVKDNEEVVIPCVSKFGFLLNYASKRLKNELAVVKAAIKGYKLDIERETYDKEQNLVAKMYKNYIPEIKNDLDVATFAVVSDSNNIKYVSDELRKKTDIVKYGIVSAVKEYFEKSGNPKDEYVSEIVSNVSNIVASNVVNTLSHENARKNHKVKPISHVKNAFNDEFSDKERQEIYDNLSEQFNMLDQYSSSRSLLK